MTNLEKLLDRIGHKGGTIHQVVRALNQVVGYDKFRAEDILNKCRFDALYSSLYDDSDIEDYLYNSGDYEGEEGLIWALDAGIDPLKDNGGIYLPDLKLAFSRL